jgi:hypothetical protein
MFYIKSEVVNDKGEKIIVCHIHSACCKTDLFFIEIEPNKFINALDRIPATEGQTKSIINARRNNLIWKS